MSQENNYTLDDFINPQKTNIEGVLVKKKNDLDYIKIKLDLTKQVRREYPTLQSFLEDTIANGNFCFINCDDCISISEEESVLFYQKSHGKLKIIFHNNTQQTLANESFFTFITWMRVIQIDNLLYFELPKNTRVLLQAKGEAKYGPKPSIFNDASEGRWEGVFAYFFFPLNERTFEEDFLTAINSEKNISMCYSEVRNLSVTRVDRVSEKGYSIGDIVFEEP
jgi:hypothetical protein